MVISPTNLPPTKMHLMWMSEVLGGSSQSRTVDSSRRVNLTTSQWHEDHETELDEW